MLDSRLKAVASFVRQGSRVADIGTDHALLPCALVAAGHCPSAIASDVRKGPVAAAERSVSAVGLSQKVHIRLGDGLSTIRPDEAEDIVIAGMGGETIADILQRAPWTKAKTYRFILQPMTRAERLRRFLFENGFSIDEEKVVVDGNRCYTVLCVCYTGKCFVPEEAVCFVGKIPLPDGAVYLERVCRRLRKQQRACPDERVAVCLDRIEAYSRGEWNLGEEIV